MLNPLILVHYIGNLEIATIINKDGKIILENLDTLRYRSKYDIKKIKSLYSNLDTVSFWNLEQ